MLAVVTPIIDSAEFLSGPSNIASGRLANPKLSLPRFRCSAMRRLCILVELFNARELHSTMSLFSRRAIQVSFLLLTLLSSGLLHATQSQQPAHTFGWSGQHFLLDGKPFQIISGEMHYARVPRPYWRQRMRLMKAMGLNTLTTYVFWNLHEPRPGEYDFTGNLDVAEYIRTAQQEGLWVILRPGPYVCAEWDFGGLPPWLLRTPGVRVRSMDPRYLRPATAYLKRVGEQLAPLQITHGGPIILCQVENEYG